MFVVVIQTSDLFLIFFAVHRVLMPKKSSSPTRHSMPTRLHRPPTCSTRSWTDCLGLTEAVWFLLIPFVISTSTRTVGWCRNHCFGDLLWPSAARLYTTARLVNQLIHLRSLPFAYVQFFRPLFICGVAHTMSTPHQLPNAGSPAVFERRGGPCD